MNRPRRCLGTDGTSKVLPLYYRPRVAIFREGVSGAKGFTNPPTALTWDVPGWELR